MSHADGGDSFGVDLPLEAVVSRPRPGVVLLEVDGEVDTHTAPRMEAGLAEALDGTADATTATVVVDLTAVTFLGSGGLAVLVRGARRAMAVGERLHVVASSRAVTRPITVTGADTILDVHPDLDSALAAAPPAAIAPAQDGVER